MIFFQCFRDNVTSFARLLTSRIFRLPSVPIETKPLVLTTVQLSWALAAQHLMLCSSFCCFLLILEGKEGRKGD